MSLIVIQELGNNRSRRHIVEFLVEVSGDVGVKLHVERVLFAELANY